MDRYFLFLIILVLGVSSLFACAPIPQEYGTLQGQVLIGPLQPVIQEGEVEPTPAPEVYAAREIVLFKENGKTEFTRVSIGPNGSYRAELPVGIYVVDINHVGIDMASDLPRKIKIAPQTVTILDISIDTGIR
jgi:hypothetical protein